jgi:hypothetical protein
MANDLMKNSSKKSHYKDSSPAMKKKANISSTIQMFAMIAAKRIALIG